MGGGLQKKSVHCVLFGKIQMISVGWVLFQTLGLIWFSKSLQQQNYSDVNFFRYCPISYDWNELSS